jgi:AcrR family transcriptional regulator
MQKQGPMSMILSKQPSASLRDAQRMLTRSRISEAAREVFFTRGYSQSTIDEIIQVAGISKSTLYAHFRDSEDLLAHIAADYTTALCEVAARLPGPVPTRAEIGTWVEEVAALIRRERTPSIVVVGLANTADSPLCIQEIGDKLFETLAIRLPVFRHALADPQGLVMAWATVAMRELGVACLQHARDNGKGFSKNALTVAGDLFARLVQEHPNKDTK